MHPCHHRKEKDLNDKPTHQTQVPHNIPLPRLAPAREVKREEAKPTWESSKISTQRSEGIERDGGKEGREGSHTGATQ